MNIFISTKFKGFILIPIGSLLLFSSCVGLLGRNQAQGGRDSSQAQANSNQGSMLSSLFGDGEAPVQKNQSSTPANIKSEPNHLPTSFQQTNKYPRRENMMEALSPLHLTHIEGNTWRTTANPVIVYGIMARLLSQNYIIASVDRKNFSVQTDWDKFFIDGRLFRNRMSVTVFPVASRQTEVVIKNSVEYYTGTVAKQEENTAWLPSPDLTNEVAKLIENTDKQTAFAYSQSMHRN